MQYLSPGVYWREVDLTTIVPQVSTTVGAIVGDFHWGPINQIVDVDSEDTLIKYFYNPTNENYIDFFTAASFLSYSNSLKVVRVANITKVLNATSNTSSQGLLIKNNDEYLMSYAQFQSGDEFGIFAARYPGELGNSIKVSMFCGSGDQNAFDAWEYKKQFPGALPGTSPYAKSKNGSDDEVHIIVIDEDGKFTGIRGSILEKYSYLSKASDAVNFDGSSNYFVDVLAQRSNYIYAINAPSLGTLANVASVEVTNGGTGYFSANGVAILGGSGGGALANVVADAAGVVTRVDVFLAGTGYHLSDILSLNLVRGTGASLSVNTFEEANSNVTSILINNAGLYYTNGTSVVLSGGASGATGLAVDITVNANGSIVSASVVDGGTGYANNDTVTIPAGDPATISVNLQKTDEAGPKMWGQPAMGADFDQEHPIYSSSLSGGVSSMPSDADIMKGYDLFGNSDDVDVSLIMTGGCSDVVKQYVVDRIVGGSEGSSAGRRDAVAFISPPENIAVNNTLQNRTRDMVSWRNNFSSSSYAVADSAWKKILDKYNNQYRWVPMNGDIAGLCARTDFTNNPWWSPAGFNRGQIKNAISISWNPSQSQRDQLYSNGINPIVNFKGQGVILYGDKTMLAKPSAFDRINVRRLFITLEKAIVAASKYSLFEFNDQFTRAQFVALIEPYLRDVKSKRGIYDFRVVCDETNNTPEIIDRNQFVGDIYIKPARSINFIQLNFVAVRTGVDFSTIVGKFG